MKGAYPAGEIDAALRQARSQPLVHDYLSIASAMLRIRGDRVGALQQIQFALEANENRMIREILDPVAWTLQHEQALSQSDHSTITVRSAAEMEPVLDLPWIIHGILLARSIAMIFGESNIGKSFICVDWAVRMAAGIDFGQRRVERKPVLYLNSEGTLDNRIAQCCRHLGIDRPADLWVGDGIPSLCEPGAADWLTAQVREIGAGVVFVDTWHAALGGEDSAPDGPTGRAVRTLKQVRDETDVTFVVVHHPGKDASKGPRGSYSLHAALDTELQATGANGSGELTLTKQRDGRRDITFPFSLSEVEIGRSRLGEPVTTMTVDWLDETAAPTKPNSRDNLPPDVRKAYTVLCDAIARHGEEPAGNVPAPGTTLVVPERAWRDSYYAARGDDPPDSKRRAFNRAKLRLESANLIAMHDPWVWLTKEKVARCDFVHR